MKTFYYSHPLFLLHETGQGHPESAERLRVIEQALNSPEFSQLERIQAPKADLSQVRLIHTQQHVSRIISAVPRQGMGYIDADTVLSKGSLDAALHAVGAACAAVDSVMTSKARNAFCASRPPGHHAEPDAAMGFCLFNNVAIAAAHARQKHAVKKVAIIDFDVHHGNGTQRAFDKTPEVLYASTHQAAWYPGTGSAEETGAGNVINIPLASGSGSRELRTVMQERILPFIDRFAPELVLVSAGFDGHRDDPLGELNFDEADYSWMTRELISLANRHAAGRLVSVLEGGYNLKALAKSVAAHVQSLMTASA